MQSLDVLACLPMNKATALAGFSSNAGALGALRGFGVEMPAYAVGRVGMAYIPGTVLVPTGQEVSWTDRGRLPRPSPEGTRKGMPMRHGHKKAHQHMRGRP